jgi:hypothetical protein
VGQRLTILRGIMVFLTVSTLVHYTHNFVEIDQYPKSFIPNWVTQVGVFVTWPVFTAFGIAGYRLYKQGRYRTAHACLITYSFVGWLTLGHFTAGNPDIPPFFYATLFTDALGAAMVTAWVVWSMRSLDPARSPRVSQ